MWVKDAAIAKENLFVIGHVVAVADTKVTVETEANGKRQEIVVQSEECFHTNQGGDVRRNARFRTILLFFCSASSLVRAVCQVPDHCQLVHLSPPTLLESSMDLLRLSMHSVATYPSSRHSGIDGICPRRTRPAVHHWKKRTSVVRQSAFACAQSSSADGRCRGGGARSAPSSA